MILITRKEYDEIRMEYFAQIHHLYRYFGNTRIELMAAIDDLKAEIATVATDVLAALDKFTNSLPPSQDPAIAQATADLKAAVQPLENFVNPPAPPAP